MKNTKKILVAASLFLICSTALSAQDWLKVAPNGKVVKADNATVRAIEVTLMPGETEPIHTHPAHVYYALSDGKLKIAYSDGKTETFDLKPGVCAYSDPERPHSTENVGKTPIKLLIVELKEHPYNQ